MRTLLRDVQLLFGERASVSLNGDLIEGAGEPNGTYDYEFDCHGALLSPGLIDAHTHLCFAGSRCWEMEARISGATYQDLAARGGGIKSTVKATREATDAELRAATERHASWCLAHGTTTLESKTGYGLSVEDELRLLRTTTSLDSPLTIIPTLLAAHAVPEGMSKGEWMDKIINEIVPQAQVARHLDIFVEEGYFDADDARRLARLGKPMRMHVDQLGDHNGAALAAELGATTADHLEHTNEAGIAAMKAAKVIPVLLPGSVYGLNLSRYANARAMIDAGLDVVIATDFNAGSSPTASLPMVMSLACMHMKMTPQEAWLGVTINAAKSLGLEDQVGTITEGKRADLVLWDTDDFRDVPFHFGTNLVRKVWKNGELVVG